MAFGKKQFSFLALFISLFIILISVLILDTVFANEQPEIKVKTVSLYNESLNSDSFLLTKSVADSEPMEVILPEIKSEFLFNGFGLKWQNDNNIQLQVKTEKSDWLAIEELTATAPSKNNWHYSEPIFIEGNAIQAKITSSSLINLELIYFDSQQKNNFSPRQFLSSAYRKVAGNNSEIKIISREEWGANEDYRFWQPQYAEPKAFVLHHTAGGDGADNPAATIRGIYYWHAVVLGWGDIGYNYLIDTQGNIYEGRYGGDGVIGAHVYNSIDEINYNEGTIGISALGCYENEANDCYQISEYNQNMQSAFTSLMAEKAVELNIDLNGERTVMGNSIASIVGHRDLDYTLCPGNLLENELPNLLSLTYQEYQKIIGEQQYQASLSSQSFLPAYYINNTADITATYQNTGALPWLKDQAYLKVYDSVSKQSSKYYLANDVQPNDSISLVFPYIAPEKPSPQQMTLKLFNSENYIYHSRKKIKIRVDNPNQAKLKKHNFPLAILSSWNPSLVVKYNNTGLIAWNNKNTALNINGQKITNLSEEIIQPGQTGTFNFSLQKIANLKKGKNKLILKLKQDNLTIKNSRLVWFLRIDK